MFKRDAGALISGNSTLMQREEQKKKQTLEKDKVRAQPIRETPRPVSCHPGRCLAPPEIIQPLEGNRADPRKIPTLK